MTRLHRTVELARPGFLAALLLTTLCAPLTAGLGPGELFVTDYENNAVTVYSRTASGDAAPTRTIQTGLAHPFNVLVDQIFGEVFVTNNNVTGGNPPRQGSVQVYDLDAKYPNDMPKRTIAGANTGLFGSTGMALDVLRQELYVANDDDNSVTVFSRKANGDVKPSRVIKGDATKLSGPVAIVFDLLHDEIIVVNKIDYLGGAGRITVFRRGASGNAAPIRVIEGVSTGLNLPVGMDLDVLHNEIAVANANSHSILFFRRTDNGDVSPLRTLSGTSTGLCSPYGVLMDVVNDEVVAANSGVGGCSPSTTVYKRGVTDGYPVRTLNIPTPVGGATPYPTGLTQTLLSF